MDLEYFALFVWLACALVVAIDSQVQNVSPWFWRIAGLAGGPFALLGYGIAREIRARTMGAGGP